MDACFHSKRWTAVFNILGLVCGILLGILFGVLILGDSDAPITDILLAWFFIMFGLLVSALCGVSLYVNKRAFIHADAESVCGYFHFGLALACRIDEIDAVSYGGAGLSIRLKNGKNYAMYKLENAYPLGRFIKQHMPLPPLTTQTRDALAQAFHEARRKRRNHVLGLVISFVLVFAGIFLTVWLTDGREMRDFLPQDWKIFRAMLYADAVLGAALVVLVRRTARLNEVCQRSLEDLHLLILRTTPLPAGNVQKVYIALDNHPPIRVTVCGFPHSEEVYCIVEAPDTDWALEKVHESKIYPSMDDLRPELEGLTEVSIEV